MMSVFNRLNMLRSLLMIVISTVVGTAQAVNLATTNDTDVKKTTLVIARVSDDPNKHYQALKPMIDYVVERLGDLGVTKGEVVLARNNRQMIHYLRQGRVDWVSETPFSAAYFQQKAGAELLLRAWRKGVAEYHSVFFTRADSAINALSDLRGRTIAFEDAGSTSAYFVPSAIMLDAGLTLTQLATVRDRPPADMVGYAFSGEEINTSTWVHKGLVDAGVLSNLDWESDDDMPPRLRNEMRIFHRTGNIPRAVELVRGGLDPRIKQRLKTILLGMHEDPAASAILIAYKTTRFEALDPNALAETGQLLQLIHSRLE